MKKPFEIKLLTLVLLWGLVFIDLVTMTSLKFNVGLSVILGLILLILCTIAYFRNKKIYRYAMFVTLILASIGLIKFSLFSASVSFWYEGLGALDIQTIPVFVLILFLFLHREQVQQTFFSGKVEDEQSDAYLSKINSFKRRFEKLSDAEIERRLNEQMVPEAMKALKQIKEERRKIDS